MTNIKDGIFWHFHLLFGENCPECKKRVHQSDEINVLQNFTSLSWKVTISWNTASVEYTI